MIKPYVSVFKEKKKIKECDCGCDSCTSSPEEDVMNEPLTTDSLATFYRENKKPSRRSIGRFS